MSRYQILPASAVNVRRRGWRRCTAALFGEMSCLAERWHSHYYRCICVLAYHLRSIPTSWGHSWMEMPTGDHPIVYGFGLQVVCCHTGAESRCLMEIAALLYMEIGSVVIIVIVMPTQLTSQCINTWFRDRMRRTWTGNNSNGFPPLAGRS